MKILVTGHLGYIGSVLVPMLSGHEVIGVDAGYFSTEPGRDIRDLFLPDFIGVEAVIHLAALSNDPLGELDASLTDEINHWQTVRIAKMAKAAGARRFIFPSSQSQYGNAPPDTIVTEDTPANPLTAYGWSKWNAEQGLKSLVDDHDQFSVVILRPATVFGWSPNLRTDLVLNEFVLGAVRDRQIIVRGDPDAWRPFIHVVDLAVTMCKALDCTPGIYNVGLPLQIQIGELAEKVSKHTDAKIIHQGNSTDGRSYRVSCQKSYSILMPFFDLDMGIRDLSWPLQHNVPSGQHGNRLSRLRSLLDSGKLTPDLRWT